ILSRSLRTRLIISACGTPRKARPPSPASSCMTGSPLASAVPPARAVSNALKYPSGVSTMWPIVSRTCHFVPAGGGFPGAGRLGHREHAFRFVADDLEDGVFPLVGHGVPRAHSGSSLS